MILLLVAGFSFLLSPPPPPQATNRWAVHTFLERAINMSPWLHAICFRPKYNIQKRKKKKAAQGNWVSCLGPCRSHSLFPGDGGGVVSAAWALPRPVSSGSPATWHWTCLMGPLGSRLRQHWTRQATWWLPQKPLSSLVTLTH